MAFDGSNVRSPHSWLDDRLHEWPCTRRTEGIPSKAWENIQLHLQPLINLITGLDQEDRDAVEQMDINTGYAADDIEAVSHTAPPGEEGIDISHEGGKFEVFDDLAAGIAESTG